MKNIIMELFTIMFDVFFLILVAGNSIFFPEKWGFMIQFEGREYFSDEWSVQPATMGFYYSSWIQVVFFF